MNSRTTLTEKLQRRLKEGIIVKNIHHYPSPDANVPGSRGRFWCDDDDGLTNGQNETEQVIIISWLLDFVGKKFLGRPIALVKLEDRDGRRYYWYKNQKKTPAFSIPEKEMARRALRKKIASKKEK